MAIVDSVSAAARALVVGKGVTPQEAIMTAADSEFSENLSQFESDFESQLLRAATHRLTGYGALQPYLDDESIEEVWVNRPDEIYYSRAGKNFRDQLSFGPQELAGVVEKMLRESGRRVDRSMPFVDASLSDGSRLHVAIPEATRSFWSVNIRKFPKRIMSLADLCKMNFLTSETAAFLSDQVRTGKNILISGATQAGKTTLLCALLSELSHEERLVSVEETFELRANLPDWVALQTRLPNLEGQGAISLRRLIKEALRMRPSRLVVGEVREAESLDLLIALNSGIPGMCTIHANSASEAVEKLATLPLLAGENISRSFVAPTVGRNISLVLHCRMHRNGERKLEQIASLSWLERQRRFELKPLFDFQPVMDEK